MKTQTVSVPYYIIISLIGITTSGCTILGGVIGAASSRGELMVSDASAFKPGTKITLDLPNGVKEKGRFLRFEDKLDDTFTSGYKAARQRLKPDVILPQLYQTVTIWLHDGSPKRVVKFLGFAGYGRTYMLAESEGGDEQRIPLEEIDRLTDADGYVSRGLDYRRTAFRHELPKSSYLVMETSSGISFFPAENIESVSKRSSYGVVLGALVGLAIDIAVLSLIFSGGGSSAGCGIFSCGGSF